MIPDFSEGDLNRAAGYLKQMLEFYQEVIKGDNSFVKKHKGVLRPNISLHQLDNELNLTLEIPGIKNSEDIKIFMSGNILRIRGVTYQTEYNITKNSENKAKKISFARSVVLPERARYKEVSANYKNGILEIRLIIDNEVKAENIKINFL